MADYDDYDFAVNEPIAIYSVDWRFFEITLDKGVL